MSSGLDGMVPALMRRTIDVTQADINKADPKNSGGCAVATAIARSIPDATRIEVDLQTIRFSLGGERLVWVTPYSVTGYVVAFDAGEDVHPFRFQLREDAQVAVRQRKPTPAGQHTERTRKKAHHRTKAVEKATRKLDELVGRFGEPDGPSKAEVQRARAELRDKAEKARTAAEERDAVMAAYDNQPKVEPPDPSKPIAPARIAKSRARTYGMRQLRINRETSVV